MPNPYNTSSSSSKSSKSSSNKNNNLDIDGIMLGIAVGATVADSLGITPSMVYVDNDKVRPSNAPTVQGISPQQILSNLASAFDAFQGGHISVLQYIDNVELNFSMLEAAGIKTTGVKATNDILGITSGAIQFSEPQRINFDTKRTYNCEFCCILYYKS